VAIISLWDLAQGLCPVEPEPEPWIEDEEAERLLEEYHREEAADRLCAHYATPQEAKDRLAAELLPYAKWLGHGDDDLTGVALLALAEGLARVFDGERAWLWYPCGSRDALLRILKDSMRLAVRRERRRPKAWCWGDLSQVYEEPPDCWSAALHEALDALPGPTRLVMRLHLEGYSDAEIAAALAPRRSKQAVQKHRERAVKEIRKKLAG
jgi:DNA-directed RNA polymerase specialized sigma24 family protein